MDNMKANEIVGYIRETDDQDLINSLDVEKKTLVIGIKNKAIASEKLDDVINLVRKSKLLDDEVSRKIRILNDMIA